MKKYEKIETVFMRDIEGTKKLIPGRYRDETVEFLKDNCWIWTEKIDGTNIRVHWDGHVVEFGGRTDQAQIPAPLVNKLNEYFGGEQNAQVFEQVFGEKDVVLFGEGYGNKIQKVGGQYNSDGVDFALFDVCIGENYMPRIVVQSVARAFGVDAVPIVGLGTIDKAIAFVQSKPYSRVAQKKNAASTLLMEGVVCRPMVELRTRTGERVICKIKLQDFKDME